MFTVGVDLEEQGVIMFYADIVWGLAQVAMLALKLTGMVCWSWWIILIPLWVFVLASGLAFWFYWRCMASGFKLDV